MANKNPDSKVDKKDHAGMKKAAQIVRGGAVVLGLICSIVPGLKGLSNLMKKS